eukprot:354900-Chlamydomonas_euryale.AAC.8
MSRCDPGRWRGAARTRPRGEERGGVADASGTARSGGMDTAARAWHRVSEPTWVDVEFFRMDRRETPSTGALPASPPSARGCFL